MSMSNSDLAVELEPCPFCGGDNVKTFGPYGWYRQWGISHSCKSFYSGSQEMFQGFHTEAEAIQAWNTRTPSTPHVAYEIEGSIYEGMEACLVKDGRTVAHIYKYSDAVELVAALSTPHVGDDVLRELLLELQGQVIQARDGFGIWPYSNSPSMADCLARIDALLSTDTVPTPLVDGQ